MNKKNILSSLTMIALLATVSTGCDKNPEPDPVEPTAVTVTVDATAYATDETNTTDKWVYVSFVQGKEVAISDFKNDASWDIAFHRMDVRLNGGESGKGQGAGQISDVTALSELTTIPTEGYITDVMDSVNVSMMEKVAAPKNLTLGTWVSMAGMPPAYTVKENVFVVKSAEGKHVKLKFLDYLNAENKGGHVKFTYVYMD